MPLVYQIKKLPGSDPAPLNFVEKVKNELGFKAAHREVIEGGGTYALREQSEGYGANFSGKNEALSSENTRFSNENSELTAT